MLYLKTLKKIKSEYTHTPPKGIIRKKNNIRLSEALKLLHEAQIYLF